MKPSLKHTEELSLSNKFCLKEIDVLDFELSRYKQRNRQTKILKIAKINENMV
jgi:hypothetical protein